MGLSTWEMGLTGLGLGWAWCSWAWAGLKIIESILNTVKVCCPVKLETSRRSSFGSPATLQFFKFDKGTPIIQEGRLGTTSLG